MNTKSELKFEAALARKELEHWHKVHLHTLAERDAVNQKLDGIIREIEKCFDRARAAEAKLRELRELETQGDER